MIRQRASPFGARSSRKASLEVPSSEYRTATIRSIHSLFERQSILLMLFISGSKSNISHLSERLAIPAGPVQYRMRMRPGASRFRFVNILISLWRLSCASGRQETELPYLIIWRRYGGILVSPLPTWSWGEETWHHISGRGSWYRTNDEMALMSMSPSMKKLWNMAGESNRGSFLAVDALRANVFSRD